MVSLRTVWLAVCFAKKKTAHPGLGFPQPYQAPYLMLVVCARLYLEQINHRLHIH